MGGQGQRTRDAMGMPMGIIPIGAPFPRNLLTPNFPDLSAWIAVRIKGDC